MTNVTTAGQLEIYDKGEWVSVCWNGLDLFEADLVCIELGYLYADRVDAVPVLG